jgi:hypothetical protein
MIYLSLSPSLPLSFSPSFLYLPLSLFLSIYYILYIIYDLSLPLSPSYLSLSLPLYRDDHIVVDCVGEADVDTHERIIQSLVVHPLEQTLLALYLTGKISVSPHTYSTVQYKQYSTVQHTVRKVHTHSIHIHTILPYSHTDIQSYSHTAIQPQPEVYICMYVCMYVYYSRAPPRADPAGTVPHW